MVHLLLEVAVAEVEEEDYLVASSGVMLQGLAREAPVARLQRPLDLSLCLLEMSLHSVLQSQDFEHQLQDLCFQAYVLGAKRCA